MSAGLYVLPLFLFWHPDSNIPAGRAAPRQKYIGGLIVGRTSKIHSDISPIPPLNFTRGVKNAKFCLDFCAQFTAQTGYSWRDPRRPLVSKGSKISKILKIWLERRWLTLLRTETIRPPLPSFWHGGQKVVRIWTFKLSSFERKQCVWNLKQNGGAPMTVLCPPKIWFSSVPHFWETGAHFRPTVNLGREMCCISQFAQRLWPRLSLKPRVRHFAYPP